MKHECIVARRCCQKETNYGRNEKLDNPSVFSHKQDSHFQAVPVKGKRKKAQMGTRASTLRPGPEVEAPSRAASPVSSTSPTLWSRGHRAAPTLLGPAQTVVVAWINVVMRSCKIANANLFQGTFPCGQEPQRLGAHPCKVRKGRRSPLSFW